MAIRLGDKIIRSINGSNLSLRVEDEDDFTINFPSPNLFLFVVWVNVKKTQQTLRHVFFFLFHFMSKYDRGSRRSKILNEISGNDIFRLMPVKAR